MVLRTRTARFEGALSLTSFAPASPPLRQRRRTPKRKRGGKGESADRRQRRQECTMQQGDDTENTPPPPQKGIGADNKSSLIESGDAQGEPHTIPRVRGKRTHHTEKYSPERLPQRGTTWNPLLAGSYPPPSPWLRAAAAPP